MVSKFSKMAPPELLECARSVTATASCHPMLPSWDVACGNQGSGRLWNRVILSQRMNEVRGDTGGRDGFRITPAGVTSIFAAG